MVLQYNSFFKPFKERVRDSLATVQALLAAVPVRLQPLLLECKCVCTLGTKRGLVLLRSNQERFGSLQHSTFFSEFARNSGFVFSYQSISMEKTSSETE